MKGTDCLTISEAYEKKENSPILIHFQNGNLKEAACEEASSGVFRDKFDTTRTTLIAVDDVVYVGQEEEDELCRTVIVDVDRKTGKVRLIEVGDASVKEISGHLPDLKDNTSNEQINNLELSRKFGSKKLKKRMEQQEKMKVNIETVNEQVKNAVANTIVSSDDLGSYLLKDMSDAYIPSINRNADVITDVYNIEDILTKEQVTNIMEEVENHDYKSELAPFLMHIMALRKDETEWKTAFILYVNALINMYTVTIKMISRKDYNPCPYSLTLSKAVLDNFTQVSQGKRARSLQYKDKTLCYAIVALLLATDFRFDLEPFIAAFNIPSGRIANKLKLIGAYIVPTGSKKQVVLKLPLCPLESKFNRRKSAKF